LLWQYGILFVRLS